MDKQLERWGKLKLITKQGEPETKAEIEPAAEHQRLNTETSQTTMDEIKEAISTLMNGKAAGPDNVPA